MTITRVKPATWGVGDKLTSAEQNALDVNDTYALDKRAGETDTLESEVEATGAGRITRAQVVMADANTTYTQEDGSEFLFGSPTITADRIYTLGNTAANPYVGDAIHFVVEPLTGLTATVKNHDGTTLAVLGNVAAAQSTWAWFRWDGTNWKLVAPRLKGQQSTQLVANGSWTCPADVFEVVLFGVGGGGGGGGGGSSGTVASPDYHGGGSGGGGGGAMVGVARVGVTPGTSYTVTIGAGGTGGAGHVGGNGAGSAGSDGTDTVFGSPALATFYGAMAGRGGAAPASGAVSYVSGGLAHRHNKRGILADANYATPPGRGGHGFRFAHAAGITSADAADGGSTALGRGGLQGATGTDVGANGGSAGGGGGGANDWPGGAPGAGGSGATPTLNFAPGLAGGNGTFGAGGGGGGGASRGSAGGTNNGGNGGNGGNGALRIVWWK